MSLIVYNITGDDVTLDGLTIVVPASDDPPTRGAGVNVTSELRVLDSGAFDLLEAQRVDTLDYTWTGDPEYTTGNLVVQGPISTDTFILYHETFVAVEAPATSLDTIASDAGSTVPAAQPNHPRNLVVTFDADWDGSDVIVNGVSPQGVIIAENFTSNPGGDTAGTKTYMSVTSWAPTVIGAGVKTATLSTGAFIGTVSGTIDSIVKILADGVLDSIVDFNPTEGSFVPLTMPNGSINYELYYFGVFAE